MVKKTLLVILALEFFYIFAVLLNYDNAWIHPEKIQTHEYFLKNGTAFKPEDLIRGIDISRIEPGKPERITRPFSNLFELINAKFRVWLWQFIPPHPSLSLSWPISFILVPILLFHFFRNMGCNEEISLGGVMLYIATIGFLGPIIMLFHPGKNFVNIIAVLCLYLASVIKKTLEKKNISDKTETHLPYVQFVLLCVMIYLSFFWDESGVFIFVIIFVLFFDSIFLKTGKKPVVWGTFFLIPVFYFWTLRGLLPYIHLKYLNKNVNIEGLDYYPSLKDLFFPNWGDIVINIWWNFKDHLNLHLNLYRSNPPLAIGLADIFYRFSFLLFAGGCAFTIIKFLRTPRENRCGRQIIFPTISAAAMLFIYCYLFTFQFSHYYRVWGAWWYTNLFSLIYVLVITFLLMFVSLHTSKKTGKIIVLFTVVGFTLNFLVFSTYRNHVFKTENLTRGLQSLWIFHSNFNQFKYFNFADSFRRNEIKLFYTLAMWESAKNGKHILCFPLENDFGSDVLGRSKSVSLNNHVKYLRVELFRLSHVPDPLNDGEIIDNPFP